MSGFDRFLKEIGAITTQEGTTADTAIPQVIKNLRAQMQKMGKPSPEHPSSMDFDLAQESLRKAEACVEENDFQRAYLHTLDVVLHLGYVARAADTVESLEAILNEAFEEAQPTR